MFKKVVSLSLSIAMALLVGMTAGAEYDQDYLEDMGNFTGSKKCLNLCKEFRKYDGMCKKDLLKTTCHLFQGGKEGHFQIDPNFGMGKRAFNILLTRGNLTVIYFARCLDNFCPGLFDLFTFADNLEKNEGRVVIDMSKCENLPDDNGCLENGQVQKNIAWHLEDMDARKREGIELFEGYN